jgi:hypothetical protein
MANSWTIVNCNKDSESAMNLIEAGCSELTKENYESISDRWDGAPWQGVM